MTQTVLLGDICDVRDGTHDSPKPKDSGHPLVTSKHIKNHKIDFSTANLVSDEDFEVVNKRSKVDQHDILISMIGTVGELALIDYEPTFAIKNIGLIKTGDELLGKYLFYYLQSTKAKQYIEASLAGSTQKFIGLGQLRKFPVELPDPETQKKVADILGTIDEKIELNRQMNETLEQMGQALFRHYFIDNPEAEKWEKRELGEFFPIKTGKKDANFGTEDGEYPFFTCAQTISKAPDFSFDAHALLLAGNGDFNLKLYRGKFEAYQRTYVLIPDDERFVGILYFLMKMKLPEITGGSRGSVIKFITKGMIENYKFALPNDSELAEMSEVFNQITVNIEENVKEIQTLTTLRDTLLPRLISGKVKV